MASQFEGTRQVNRPTIGDCFSTIMVGFTPGTFILFFIILYFQDILPLLSKIRMSSGKDLLPFLLKASMPDIKINSAKDLSFALIIFLILTGICQMFNGLMATFVSKRIGNRKLYTVYLRSSYTEVKANKCWSYFNFLIGTVCPLIIPIIVGFAFFDIKMLNMKISVLLAFSSLILIAKLDKNWSILWEDIIKTYQSSLFMQPVQNKEESLE